ncbi:M4 family metallopeptidase [Myxococcaceae bacterium JPH2]|nr:M4 family metallopeptidase [Myxococcaceae bacterium JPH2]
MSKVLGSWPIPLLSLLLSAGPGQAATGLKPVSREALTQIRAKQDSRVALATQRIQAARSSLGLGDRDGFQLRTANTDRFGQTHVRFQQTFSGVPVWGGDAIVHLDVDNGEQPATTHLYPGVRMPDVRPALQASEALTVAEQDEGTAAHGAYSVAPQSELVIYPVTQEQILTPEKSREQLNAVDVTRQVTRYALAWHIHTELSNKQDGVRHTDYIVDSQSGEVLRRWNALQTAAAVGTGNSQYSGTVALQTNQLPDGTFELRDTTRGSTGNITYSAEHGDADLGPVTLIPYTDADNTWGNGQQYIEGNPTMDITGQTAAVDAHFGLQTTWDFYKNVMSRHGIDDRGTATFNRVHYKTAYDNAFWSNGCFCMTYGDGAGFTTLTAIDVSAHEMSHGVMANTAALIYAEESGGLNEANSDIMGTMVEFYLRGKNATGSVIGDTGGNWSIGEQLDSEPLRYMFKPSKDGLSPDAWTPDLYKVDVHYSSGPMNRAFYFLSVGATTTGETSTPYLPQGMGGIGNDKAAAIWYRAITTYLFPASNYVAARTACLQSARDLFGSDSAEFRAVQNAFAGINVGYTAGTYDDRVPPQVAASVVGNAGTLRLEATASDNVGVTRVQFVVDGVIAGESVSLPFFTMFNSQSLANGVHQLQAIAQDAAGNRTTSASVAFMVSNQTEQLLINPGFELGDFGWDHTDAVLNYPVSSGSHRGSGYIWLDGYGTAHTDNLSQLVTIPAGTTSASLSFWLSLTTAETTTTAVNDYITISVRDPQGNVLQTLATYSNLDADLDYVQRSYDLTAYAGQTIRIFLEAVENSSRASNFKLDDFALRVSSTPDVTAPTVNAYVQQAGNAVGLYADVSDDSALSSVKFLVDGTEVASKASSYSAIIPTSSLTNGSHTLVVTATDVAGHTASSTPVSFFIDRTTTQLLLNPGFETVPNPAAAWTFTSVPSSTSINNVGTSSPRSGLRLAIFNGAGVPNTGTMRQTVTVPAAATSAVLTFWTRILSTAFADGQVHDTFTFQIRDSSGNVLATPAVYSNLDDTAGVYVMRTFNLSAYKGQTLQLFFTAVQTAPVVPGGFTRVRVDDFSLAVSTAQDTNPPRASVAVKGTYGNISITAGATDNVWVSQVDVYVDGTLVRSQQNPPGPFTVAYDTRGLTNGDHTVEVRATDVAGNVGTASQTFGIYNSTIQDTQDPTVTGSVSGTHGVVTLAATASDDTGVTEVEFYVDNLYRGRSVTAPYVVPFDLSTVAYGTHTLTVRAYDAYGHEAVHSVAFERVPVSVAVAPASAIVRWGETVNFGATVLNTETNSAATWSLQEGPAAGSISATGVYTAPSATGTFHVVATSVEDPTRSASATVRVYTGDINADGLVDGEDMGVLAQALGAHNGDAHYAPAADLDGNGLVDDNDITLFIAEFGR